MERRKTIDTGASVSVGERSVSLTDQVYARVRQDIVEVKWRPGDIVLENDLAIQYGVSKTPVREALRLLVQENWIIILPRKGYLIRPLRLGDIGEVFGLRMMIEPSLISDTAANGGPAGVEALARHLQSQQAAKDLQSSLDAARAFHLAGAQFAQNRRAEEILERLLDEVRRLHFLMPDVESHITSAVEVEAHEHILRAVEAKQPERAAELMREHLAEVARTMTDAFSRIRVD